MGPGTPPNADAVTGSPAMRDFTSLHPRLESGRMLLALLGICRSFVGVLVGGAHEKLSSWPAF